MKYFGCLIGRDEKQSTGISNYYKNLSAITIFNAREKLALLIFPTYEGCPYEFRRFVGFQFL